MLAMNAIGYDAMVVGNHEYNFGLDALRARARAARFPWLSANTETERLAAALRAVPAQDRGRREGRGHRHHDARDPAVGEAGEHPRPLVARSGGGGAQARSTALAPEHPDVILAAVHGGLGRDPETGAREPERPAGREPGVVAGRALPAARGGDLRPQRTGASPGAASTACCWCSRATGRWTWRAWTSRSSASPAGASSS